MILGPHKSKRTYRREQELCKEVGKWGSQAEKVGGGVFEMKSRSQLGECCVKVIASEGAAQKANAQTFWEITSSSE